MTCADVRSRMVCQQGSRFRFRMTRTEIGVILIAVGLFTLAVSSLADVLRFGANKGFGWQQDVGLGLAAVLTLTGSLFGVLALVVIGIFVGCITLMADFLAFGSNPGFGIQQVLGTLLGALVLAVGLRIKQKPVPPKAEPPVEKAPTESHKPADDSTTKTPDP